MKNITKMKNILLLILITLTIFACKSKEDKAKELIRNDMFKTLYDFESYEPIEIKIDSAFTSIYTDSLALAFANTTIQFLKEVQKYLSNIKSAQGTMEIWADSYSPYGSYQYKAAKNDFNENFEKADITMERVYDLFLLIQKRKEQINNDFCGWKVIHKFRAKTKEGLSDLGNYMYIFDNKMTTINYREDLNDQNCMYLKSTIKEALDYTPKTSK